MAATASVGTRRRQELPHRHVRSPRPAPGPEPQQAEPVHDAAARHRPQRVPRWVHRV